MVKCEPGWVTRGTRHEGFESIVASGRPSYKSCFCGFCGPECEKCF